MKQVNDKKRFTITKPLITISSIFATIRIIVSNFGDSMHSEVDFAEGVYKPRGQMWEEGVAQMTATLT